MGKIITLRSWAIRLLILFALVSLAYFFAFRDTRPVLSIGYISSPTPNSSFNKLNIRLIERAISRINTSRTDIRLELLRVESLERHVPDDEQGNTTELYQLFNDRNDVLFVIDNSWGQHISAAANTIRNSGIPVIFLNGDKGNSDVGPRTVFIGSGDRVPADILSFISKILEEDQVIFLSEHSYPLGKMFSDLAPGYGVNIEGSRTCHFDLDLSCKNEEDLKLGFGEGINAVNFIDTKISENPDKTGRSPLILLNAHVAASIKLLDALESQGQLDGRYNVIAPPFVLGAVEGKQYSNIRLYLQTDPMNSLSYTMYQELENLETLSQSPNRQLFVNRIDLTEKLIMLALDREMISRLYPGWDKNENSPQTKLKQYRQQATDLFRLMSLPGETGKPQKTVLGDRIEYFDAEHRLVGRGNFDIIQGRERVSFPRQLNARGDIIPNHIVRITDLDISSINQRDETFNANFSLLIHSPCNIYPSPESKPGENCEQNSSEYRQIEQIGDRSHGALGILAESIRFKNMKNLNSITPLAFEKEILGKEQRYTYIFRISGEFFSPFNFRDYPFDEQELIISAQMTKSPERMRVSIDSNSQYSERTDLLNQERIQGWDLRQPFFTRDSIVSWFPQYGLRDLGLRSEMFQTFNLRVPIRRLAFKPVLLVILPLLMIGIAAVSILYISKLTFEGAGEVSVVIFLTLITYSLTLPDIIPSIEEASRTNALFILNFILVVSQFLYIVYLNSRFSSNFRECCQTHQTGIAVTVTVIYLSIFIAVLGS
ncbi:hypothetical protein MNBD_GAMMA15-1005 [hydrothermal vent metagenome]|uniref:Uncharacterized protein n=1 Tax=hydrothermal vent metagenome TaxID=652676 RepID=A0A3B0Y9T5_9ZZZZ